MDSYFTKEESHFGEAYVEEETFNITKNFEEWEEFVKNAETEYFVPFFNDKILSLAQKAKAYMLGPIGKDGKTVILSKTSSFDNVEDIEKLVDFSKIYLYCFL